jgi:hypothetical protein
VGDTDVLGVCEDWDVADGDTDWDLYSVSGSSFMDKCVIPYEL